MDQHSKSELIRVYRKRYSRATKREKTRIIDTVIEATGYSREDASKQTKKLLREISRHIKAVQFLGDIQNLTSELYNP